MKTFWTKWLLIVGVLCLLVPPAWAQDKSPTAAETALEHGFYLQVQEHDLTGAAAAFEKALADPSASDKVRQQAKSRLAAVREDLASASFAHLMPSDTMGYAEITNPGEHIARVLKMMGLLDPPAAGAAAADKPIPLGKGLAIPTDFTISPALVEELKKIRGVAVGIRKLDDRGRPSGLAVIHPGDCQLIRGLIETGVQILEPGEPIEGFKTFRVPDLGWVMLTTRLVFVSDTRDQLPGALARLRDPQAESLATRAEFKRVQAQAQGALVFAYVDGQQVVKQFGSLLPDKNAAMIRGLLDLDHFESAVAWLTTTDNGLRLQAQMNLMDGHHNMLYALIRTAPITHRSLAQVPRGAAGVVVVGLNPAGPPVAETPGQAPPAISAMDIGRELFGNIEELSLFAMQPANSETAQPLPDVGLVIAVKDAAKSEALWSQILTLATMFGARTEQPITTAEIEGKPAHIYHFAGLPPVALVRSPDRGLIIGTQPAVAAALRAALKGESIATDEAFGPLLAQLTPQTSKAVLVDVGRAVNIASAMSKGRQARELQAIGALTRDLKFSLVTDEAPNQLTIRAEATGLPKFRAIAEMIRAQQQPRGVTANK